MGEGANENADGELAWLVLENPLNDARENCPMASCTTTMVMVKTSAARLTIEAATVPKISIAASGPPLIDFGTSS